MVTLKVDGQTLSHTAGAPAAFQKFTWHGSGTHEAQLSVRFGNTDLGFASGEGLWAAFHLFQKANQSTAAGSYQFIEMLLPPKRRRDDSRTRGLCVTARRRPVTMSRLGENELLQFPAERSSASSWASTRSKTSSPSTSSPRLADCQPSSICLRT